MKMNKRQRKGRRRIKNRAAIQDYISNQCVLVNQFVLLEKVQVRMKPFLLVWNRKLNLSTECEETAELFAAKHLLKSANKTNKKKFQEQKKKVFLEDKKHKNTPFPNYELQ